MTAPQEVELLPLPEDIERRLWTYDREFGPTATGRFREGIRAYATANVARIAAERDIRERAHQIAIERHVAAEIRAQRAEAERDAARKEVERLREALEFYADPETYHAISFLADSPCGSFADDFSNDHGHLDYDREMPGKVARQALATITDNRERGE